MPSIFPPSDEHDSDEPIPESEPGSEGLGGREGARRLVERMIKEGVKRAVEKGVEQITEGPENLRQYLHEIKMPKEVASYVFAQADETKTGLYRVVAKEVRDFLEHTNLAEEMTRALTTLSFEIKTEIRFIPNDSKVDGENGKKPKPEVKSSVRVRDSAREG
jgi:hypothetical protein